jgi:hypothetical protein
VPTYRTGNNAYCIQSIGAAGGTGVAVANTAGAIFGLQRQDLAYDTRTLERTYRDFTFDPARHLGEQETAAVLPSEGGAVGSWDFAGTASGQTSKRGTATGTFTYTGAATGQATKRGTGTGSWSLTGTAGGARQSRGTASGAWTFTGTSWGWNGLPFTEDFASGTWDNWTRFVSDGAVGDGFSVSGGAGVVTSTHPTNATQQRAILTPAPTTLTDQGVLFTVVQTGSAQILCVTLRAAGFSVGDISTENGCAFFLYGGGDDSVDFYTIVEQSPVNQSVTVGSGSRADRVDGVKYWVRAETVGTVARIRTWADGSPEPTTWMTADEGTGVITAGSLAIGAYNDGSSTVVLDDITYYDAAVSEGTGTGSWSFAGTATGNSTRSGTATGAAAFTGAATGTTQKRGTAVGGLTYTGTATGSTVQTGTATGSIAWTSEAAGTTAKRGTSSGLTTWAGAAVGDAPVPGLQDGSGSGSWTYTGTALGTTTKRGTASGSWLYTGTAAGTAPGEVVDPATPPERMLTVAADSRIFGVPTADRQHAVSSTDRILPVYDNQRRELVT